MQLTSDLTCPQCEKELMRIGAAPLGRYGGQKITGAALICPECGFVKPLVEPDKPKVETCQ